MTRVMALQEFPRHARPAHIHGDILERLPLETQRALTALQAAKGDTHQAKLLANSRSYNVLRECFEQRGSSITQSWCHIHSSHCSLYQTSSDDASGLQDPTWVTFNAAGTSCKDDSAFGQRQKEAGPGFVAFLTWAHEVKLHQWVLWLHENTPQHEPRHLCEMLGETYEIYTMVLCPSSLGYPVRRGRRYTMGIRKDWVLIYPLHQILHLLGGTIQLSPGCFWVAESLTDCAELSMEEMTAIKNTEPSIGDRRLYTKGLEKLADAVGRHEPREVRDASG